VYGLDSSLIAPGKAADIVLLDAPDGGTQTTALAAIKHGDIVAVGGVVTAGVPRFVGRSRNTPGTTRKARVAVSRVMQDFVAAAHKSMISKSGNRFSEKIMLKQETRSG